MKRAGAVFVFLLVALALPACSKDKKAAEAAKAGADLVPADAQAFFSVSLEPSAEQQENLLEFADRFPDAPDDWDEVRDELLKGITEDSDVDPEEVEEWIGDEVVAALLPSDDPDGISVGLLKVEDKEKAADSAEAFAEEAEDDDSEESRVFIAGDYIAFVSGNDRREVTDAAREVKALADEKNEKTKTLGDNAEFETLMDELGDGQFVVGWADIGAAYEAASELTPGFAQSGLDPSKLPSIAFELTAEEDSVAIAGVVGKGLPTLGQDVPQLAAFVPDDALMYLSIFDPGSLVGDVLEAQGAEFYLEMFADAVGLEADELLATFNGEAAFVLAGLTEANFQELQSGLDPSIDGGFLMEIGDPDVVQQLLDLAVAEAAAGGEQIQPIDVAGRPAYALPPQEDGTQPAFAVDDDRFLFTVTPTFMTTLMGDPGDTLDQDDRFNELFPSDEESAAVFFLDLANWLPLAMESEGASTDEELALAEEFDAIGFRLWKDDDFYRFDGRILLK